MEPVTVQIPEDTKEARVNLIFKITFVILLLVLVGEVAYYFISSNNKKVSNFLPSLITTPSINTTSSNKILSPTPTKEFRGKIIDVELDKSPFTDYKDGFTLNILDPNNPNNPNNPIKLSFAYNKNAEDYIEVYDKSGKKISYKDIKSDMVVQIVFSSDSNPQRSIIRIIN